jgi:hypothetical protein
MATSSRGSTPVRSDKDSAPFQAMTIKSGQQVAFTAVSAASGILDQYTSLVKLFPTQDCWVKVGASGSTTAAVPSAGVNAPGITFLPGGLVEFIGIPENTTNPVIAVISNGTDGTLYISEAN